MELLSRDRTTKMDELTSSEEAVIGRSGTTIKFNFRVDEVVPKGSEVFETYDATSALFDKKMARKARSAHVMKHDRQYTFPIFYLNSCPIRLSIDKVKVRRQRNMENLGNVEGILISNEEQNENNANVIPNLGENEDDADWIANVGEDLDNANVIPNLGENEDDADWIANVGENLDNADGIANVGEDLDNADGIANVGEDLDNANVRANREEKDRDLGKWCRLTVVYRFKRLGCACSSKKKTSEKSDISCPSCRPANFTLQATVRPHEKDGQKGECFEDSITLYNCNRKDKLYSLNLKKVAEKNVTESEVRFCNNFKLENTDKEALAKCRSSNSIIISTVASLVYTDQKKPLVRKVPLPIEMHQRIMRRVMNDAIRSDFVIKVDNKEISCHKAMLEAHSCVFGVMFSSEMSERQNSEVVIEDMSSDAVKALVEYMYTGEISHFAKDIGITFELLRASLKYCMEELFECCRRLLYFSNFELLMDVETTAELFSFIHQSGRPELEVLDTKCFETFKLRKNELTESARYVELMESSTLRQLFFKNILSVAGIPI